VESRTGSGVGALDSLQLQFQLFEFDLQHQLLEFRVVLRVGDSGGRRTTLLVALLRRCDRRDSRNANWCRCLVQVIAKKKKKKKKILLETPQNCRKRVDES
jgi:hypothetical protein